MPNQSDKSNDKKENKPEEQKKNQPEVKPAPAAEAKEVETEFNVSVVYVPVIS